MPEQTEKGRADKGGTEKGGTEKDGSETSEKKKRLVTGTKKWDFDIDTLTLDYQLNLLESCFLEVVTSQVSDKPIGDKAIGDKAINTRFSAHVRFLEQQIHGKWYGYRAQDTEKQLYDPTQLVSEPEIAELLIASQLQCFYCRKPIQLFYEYVRESSQWSLERIDNTMGHNRGNVVIACLSCNLRRKTMYFERYVATKQMVVRKLDQGKESKKSSNQT